MTRFPERETIGLSLISVAFFIATGQNIPQFFVMEYSAEASM